MRVHTHGHGGAHADAWVPPEPRPSKGKGRRVPVVLTSWAPILLPFIALFALVALRSTIVGMLEDGNKAAAAAPAAAAAAVVTVQQQKVAAAAALPPRQKPAKHCSNTCFKANDGVCDEGRPASKPAEAAAAAGGTAAAASAHRRSLQGNNYSEQRQQQKQQQETLGPHGGARRQLREFEGQEAVSTLLCDLGTDCGDCGAWEGTVPEGWGEAGGPVAWIRAEHNASLYVRRTDTPKSFLAAITYHKADPDVSAMLHHYGAMEGGINRILHHVLDGQCEGTVRAGRRAAVLDIGASFGYYTVQAALYGCRVVAFEPVRKFRALLDWTVHAAGVSYLVDVVDKALSDVAGDLPIGIPRDGTYWGLASIHGVNLMGERETKETITVPATTLDAWDSWAPSDLRREDLLLIKMDIEGWEGPVLRGGSQLLTAHGDNLLLEYSPGIFERRNMTDFGPQVLLPEALLALLSSGFALAHLPLFAYAAPWPPRRIDPAEPLPALEEVTEAMLRHDLQALKYRQRMEVSPGGCPMPEELLDKAPAWRGCREWSYGTHPKGFRSAFGFNTNVWASRRRSAAFKRHMKLDGTAALFDEGQDMKVWTSLKRPGTAYGLINCTLIGAGHVHLFRCACQPGAPAECREAEAVVTRLATEGKMPFTGPESGGDPA
ncbi:hypothetical protein HYH02_008565 [Chlamydomonas schloesseri]|uniref:Methyltransferase FkbM domain-containing protein n=1 Tax=Chlamydomonas schloesseri TaxID=2026947 RepID=A0A835WFI8_9CHLO|nr:hypothetical protein HYH02_008565 [Chlamydomonas schloesseri]|eukprot:KAG2446579.1 hypothetical protein HYH02_008565 [Chlamydomonas schloesseri]